MEALDNLQQGALQFRRGANNLRKQMWWKNMKLNLIIGLVILIIIIIIIGNCFLKENMPSGRYWWKQF